MLINIRTYYTAANDWATTGAAPGTEANPWVSGSNDTYNNCNIERAVRDLIAAGPPYGAVYIPAGWYRIDAPINLTSNLPGMTGQAGFLAGVFGITIYGDGAISSVLMGNTGGIVIDTTGQGHVTLRDFGIKQKSDYATPSTIGIFQARATGSGYIQFPQHHNYERLYMTFATSEAGSGGTIGVYNYSAETCRYVDLQINADHPIVLTSDNYWSKASSQSITLLQGPCSNNQILGGAFFALNNSTEGSIFLQGQVDDTIIDGAVLQRYQSSFVTSPPGWPIRIRKSTTAGESNPDLWEIVGVTVRGVQIEQAATDNPYGGVLWTDARLRGLRIDASYAPLPSAAVDAIRLGGTYAEISSAELHIMNANIVNVVNLISDNGSQTMGVSNSVIYVDPSQQINLAASPFFGNRLMTRGASLPTIAAATLDAGRVIHYRQGAALFPLLLPSREVSGLSNGDTNHNITIGNVSYVRLVVATTPSAAFGISGFAAYSRTIASISVSGGVVSLTVTGGHGFRTDDWVSITGVTGGPPSINNRYKVTYYDENTVTLQGVTGSGTYSGGTVRPIPEDGRMLNVWNHTGQALKILNLNTGSSDGLKLYTNTGGDVTLRAGDSCATFVYDRTGFVWVLLSTN